MFIYKGGNCIKNNTFSNHIISNPIQDDQLLLLKGSFFELWVLRISALLLPINHQSNGVQNAMAMPSPQGNSLLWQQLMQVLGGELFQTMYAVAQEFNQLCMLETEVALYGGSLIAARGESSQIEFGQVWFGQGHKAQETLDYLTKQTHVRSHSRK